MKPLSTTFCCFLSLFLYFCCFYSLLHKNKHINKHFKHFFCSRNKKSRPFKPALLLILIYFAINKKNNYDNLFFIHTQDAEESFLWNFY
ncbi:hypothetical protein B7699_06710 [Streptococcus mitis]|uniref:Uncharacterized protein n=1 Tax=Streptococcus mitis TaxID=28037 RepID=A0A1X1K143_STRMT|nr:hypothetical protein B7699_06710 [Streptococcus mitis]